MSYDSILERTIPQLEAIMSDFEDNISLKSLGSQLFSTGTSNKNIVDDIPKSDGSPPKLSEFMNFANEFKGIS